MITQNMVMELRAKTGAGIMNCRDTLNETNGDMEKAVALLRKKGLIIAAKKAERATTEGLIGCHIFEDHKAGAIVELNCETDFVAVNEEFVVLAGNLARQAVSSGFLSLTDFAAQRYIADENITVREAITSVIAKLRENITLRRFTAFSSESGFIQGYLHGGRIGVLLEIDCTDVNPALLNIGKEIAMQIAATNPLFIAKSDVDPEILVRESETFRLQALNEGKPEPVAAKIVAGKIAKYLKEKCLMEQVWIKNEDLTISDYLQERSRELGTEIRIVRFARFEKGEGLVKKADHLVCK